MSGIIDANGSLTISGEKNDVWIVSMVDKVTG